MAFHSCVMNPLNSETNYLKVMVALSGIIWLPANNWLAYLSLFWLCSEIGEDVRNLKISCVCRGLMGSLENKITSNQMTRAFLLCRYFVIVRML
jgi:hypothetical protein